jgi:hypothetical protein
MSAPNRDPYEPDPAGVLPASAQCGAPREHRYDARRADPATDADLTLNVSTGHSGAMS